MTGAPGGQSKRSGRGRARKNANVNRFVEEARGGSGGDEWEGRGLKMGRGDEYAMDDLLLGGVEGELVAPDEETYNIY